MEIARTYACPGCGASVVEDARHCTYCHAPVATVRCARCFHLNAPVALHCSGCGQELGLEPIGESAELSCPDCHEALSAFRSAAGTLYDCAGCGGQLVEQPLLVELLERRELYGGAAPRPAARRNENLGRVRYVRCPACGVHMNRKNFGASSGVIVDVCRKHGMWFDEGELPRVLAFVESGGLARARQREAEEQAQALRDLRARVARGEGAPFNAYSLEAPSVSTAFRELMEFVGSLTRR
jgi:Zn-finger nucleic acid-binding protein